MGALRLGRESSRDQQGESPVGMVQSEAARDRHTAGSVVLVPGSGPAAGTHPDLCTKRLQSQPGAGMDHTKVRRTAGFPLVSGGLSRSQLPLCLLPLSDGHSASSGPGCHLPVSDVHGGAELHSW